MPRVSTRMGRRRQLSGARILITGSSQGIGLSLTELAARRGASVMAVARSADLLADLGRRMREAGLAVETAEADVTNAGDRQRLVAAVQASFGGLDVLINNAGIGATGHFVEAAPDRLRKIMEVNFFGVTEMIRAFLPILRAGTKPAIVNISSIAGKRGIPARSEYSASKFAVEGFSQALRAELAKWNIDVLVVAPGLTKTNFSKNMLEQKALMPIDHLRGMRAEDVAEATLLALERGTRSTVLTLNGKLLAWISRFLPRIADHIAARKVRSLFREEIERRRQAPP